MVIICIVLISLSGRAEETLTNLETKGTIMEQVLTIVFAVLAGLFLGVNSIDMYACLSHGIDGNKMNVDGYFVKGLILIPFFAYEQVSTNIFVFTDLLIMTIFVLSVLIGSVFFTKALQLGQAGPL